MSFPVKSGKKKEIVCSYMHERFACFSFQPLLFTATRPLPSSPSLRSSPSPDPAQQLLQPHLLVRPRRHQRGVHPKHVHRALRIAHRQLAPFPRPRQPRERRPCRDGEGLGHRHLLRGIVGRCLIWLVSPSPTHLYAHTYTADTTDPRTHPPPWTGPSPTGAAPRPPSLRRRPPGARGTTARPRHSRRRRSRA